MLVKNKKRSHYSAKHELTRIASAVHGDILDASPAPLIGIGSEELPSHFLPGFLPNYHGQMQDYHKAIIRAGGAPVILPHFKPSLTNKRILESMYSHLDGILLPGGYDVNPKLYGQKRLKTTDGPVNSQDEFELWMIKKALKDGKPILATCRGMHLLNVALGGTISQNIHGKDKRVFQHNITTKSIDFVAHHLKIKSRSKLKKALGIGVIGANSRHHQAIKKLGEGLKATAKSRDGTIEAVETKGKNWVVGVESHPESMLKKVPRWGGLYAAFVIEAARYSHYNH